MRRVLAVVLIATLTTLMLGIDTTSWAGRAATRRSARSSRPRSRRLSTTCIAG